MGAAQSSPEPSAPSFPQPDYDNTKTTVKSTFGKMRHLPSTPRTTADNVAFAIIVAIGLIALVLYAFFVYEPRKKK